MNIPFTVTGDGLTVILNAVPYYVAKDSEEFATVHDLVTSETATEEDILKVLSEKKAKLEEAVKITEDVTIQGGLVLFKGEPTHPFVSTRMLQMLEEGFDVVPMAKALSKLMENPSNRVYESFFQFLDYGKIPLTPSGNFLAYKAVREDYRDIHSGKFDNSIGAVVSMSRNQVNDNPEETCSHGLHVCSFEYLPHFSHANGHVMLCEISPADVVSIPVDYNNTKMRVCKYTVVGEYADYYTKHAPAWDSTVVGDDDDDADFFEEDDSDWSLYVECPDGVRLMVGDDVFFDENIVFNFEDATSKKAELEDLGLKISMERV